MRFNAGCTLEFNSEIPTPTILMLRPRSGIGQFVLSESYEFTPHIFAMEYTDSYGNLCQRVILPEGRVSIKFEVCVELTDRVDINYDAKYIPVEFLPNENLRFLLPSRYCQSDLMSDFAYSIIDVNATGYVQVETIRAWIHQNVKYEYNTTDSSTSAVDILKNRVGVCRDFAHLGIALCRSINIPARIVVGYLYELKPMDLHAWFEAYIGNRWYIFDATQATPKANRIAVAYGFDAADVAISSHFGATTLETMEVWINKID